MLGFMDCYTLWRCLPFPRNGSSDGLILAHSDLAEADEYATTVIRFVERGIFKPAPVDFLALVGDILERTNQLCDDASSDADREIARAQHAYAALLQMLYSQFLEAGARIVE